MRVYIRWVVAIVGIVFLVWLGYQAGRGTQRRLAENGRQSSPKPDPVVWRTINDPAGFSIDLPTDWTLKRDQATSRIEVRSHNGESVLLWPVWISTKLDEASASVVLVNLAKRVLPQIEWRMLPTNGMTAVRLRGDTPDTDALALLTWVSSPRGSAAVASVISAHVGKFGTFETTCSRIIGSFRVIGSPPQKEKKLKFVPWVDPKEQAFTMDIPVQWNVTGGLTRSTSGDGRPSCQIVSPDHQIVITAGDSRVTDFLVPDPILLGQGLSDGSWFIKESGAKFEIRPFMAGLQFATEFVKGRGYTDLILKEATGRPDLAETIRRVMKQGGMVSQRVSVGEIAYTCSADGRSFYGFCFTGTVLMSSDVGGGEWFAPFFYNILATPDRMEQARTVLQRILRTLRFRHDWWASQERLAGKAPEMFDHAGGRIAQSLIDSYWAKNRPPTGLDVEESNSMMTVDDPAKKQSITIAGGANYFWIDARGKIVGTEIYCLPSIDFTSLVRLP